MDEPQQQPEPTPAEKDLAAANAKAEENLNGWKRAAADYANLKKENEKQREEVAKYAAAALMSALLPAVDHFGKALEQKPAANADAKLAGQWIDGIAIVKKEFDSIFAAVGLAVINEAGVPFDPTLHEAMMSEHGEKPGQVVKVLELGYKFHDRILRPAKVVVTE